MQRAIGAVWLGLVALLSGTAVWAEEYRPGDKVVVIEDANLTVSGNKVVDKVFPGLVLKVGDTNGEWLWVSNGKPGWLPSKSVIPLDRRAIERLTDMIKATPTADLYSSRANVWEKLGELDIALADSNEAIRLNPRSSVYYTRRGNRFSAKKDYDKAIQDYDEAIRINPKDALTYNNRGRAWFDKNEYDKAIRDYDEAIRLEPKYVSAYRNRGNTWKAKEAYDKAIQDYDEAIRLDPKDVVAYNNRGNAWFDKQEYDKAIQDYDEAIRLDPKDVVAYNNRGNAWFDKQEYDKAIRDYDEAIRLDPKYVYAYGNRGNSWRAKQEYDKAIQDYDEAIRLDPGDALDYNNRGNAWRFKQEYDKAIADYREALRLDPKLVMASFNLGRTHFVTRDKQAPDQFQACIDNQGWTGSLASYSVILGSQSAQLLGKPERAKKFLDDSAGKLKTDWPYPVVQLLRGELDEPGLLALATDNDKLTEAHCYLGIQQLIASHPDEARTHFQWVRDHGNKSYIPYDIAIAELKRLDQK